MANNIVRESAILWIKANTTFDTNIDPLPANVELFIQKYEALMNHDPSVASESISGLSQSFNTSQISSTLKQFARELIGGEYMKSDARAIPALDKWTY